jgi:hypothetical protein
MFDARGSRRIGAAALLVTFLASSAGASSGRHVLAVSKNTAAHSRAQVRITGKLPHPVRISDGYKEYYPRPFCFPATNYFNCTHYTITVTPKLTGEPICAIEQKLTSTGWKTFYNPCGKLNSNGRWAEHLHQPGLGRHLRTRGVFPDDGTYRKNATPWAYFKFVRFTYP